jgi:hypothetical protein
MQYAMYSLHCTLPSHVPNVVSWNWSDKWDAVSLIELAPECQDQAAAGMTAARRTTSATASKNVFCNAM